MGTWRQSQTRSTRRECASAALLRSSWPPSCCPPPCSCSACSAAPSPQSSLSSSPPSTICPSTQGSRLWDFRFLAIWNRLLVDVAPPEHHRTTFLHILHRPRSGKSLLASTCRMAFPPPTTQRPLARPWHGPHSGGHSGDHVACYQGSVLALPFINKEPRLHLY